MESFRSSSGLPSSSKWKSIVMLPSVSWADWKFVTLRVGKPRDRSTNKNTIKRVKSVVYINHECNWDILKFLSIGYCSDTFSFVERLTCCYQSRENPALPIFHVKFLFPEFLQNSSTSGPGSGWSAVLRVGLSPSTKKNPTVTVIVIGLWKNADEN